MSEDWIEEPPAGSWLTALLSGSHDGVVMFTDGGRVVWLNAAAEQMFGASATKLAGSSVDGLFPERCRGPYQEIIRDVVTTGTSPGLGKRRVLEGLRAGGAAEFPIDMAVSAFQHGSGWAFVAFVRDKTEDKMAEDALGSAYRDLQEKQLQLAQAEKMASIGQLAAGVAHEINNPIGFVASNLRTLTEYMEDLIQLVAGYEPLLSSVDRQEWEAATRDAAHVRSVATKINAGFLIEDAATLTAQSLDGVQRIRHIVQSLKDFANLDQAERKPYNVNQGIDAALVTLGASLTAKAAVVKELGSVPDVLYYPQQLNQALMNILLNAGQSIAGAGTIWVRSGMREQDVVLEIEDTGRGIAPEHLQRIFEPFFTTKPVGHGMGLGLSIAYGIVRRHGGQIEVESEVGKGSRFRITIPCSVAESERAA